MAGMVNVSGRHPSDESPGRGNPFTPAVRVPRMTA